MKKKLLMLLSLTSLMCLGACGPTSSGDYIEEYTVIWQNDNGDILEMDRHVKEGTLPSYDGETPTKESDGSYQYTFQGWEPEIHAIYENTTFTATYTKEMKSYTITWVNDNDEILEVDKDVPYGTIPTYDGATPQKEKKGDINYIFMGWTPSIHKVTEDQTYKATYLERKDGEKEAGMDPVLLEDGKTIQYGFYPQTHVKDETLIAQLSQLSPLETNGWYMYGNRYYTKEIAKVYNNETYTFDDGDLITNGNEYWFECKPIEWKVLSQENGMLLLLSKQLLDAHNFYQDYVNRTENEQTIYANNYEKSDVRAWLNSDFLNLAFSLNAGYLQEVTVNNEASTTEKVDNTYASNNTKDKVYLPSYQDYLNVVYGFENDASKTSSTRECRVTDYARIKGAWMNDKNNGSYWTRSPVSEYNYCAWNVNSGGYLSTYAVDGNSHCVRPSISILAQI